MEKQKQIMNITREELDDFMRELESLKSTIEILRDEEAMKNIKESERLLKEGAKLEEFKY